MERLRLLSLSATAVKGGGGPFGHAIFELKKCAERWGVKSALLLPFGSQAHDSYAVAVATTFSQAGVKITVGHRVGDLAEAIQSAEAFVVPGGNTMVLLEELRSRTVLNLLGKRVRSGIPYFCASAGCNILCPTVLTSNDMNITGITNFAGMSVLPFQVNPHFTLETSAGAGESRTERLREFLESHSTPTHVLGLTDQAGILVETGRIDLFGGDAHIFGHAHGNTWCSLHRPGADLGPLLLSQPLLFPERPLVAVIGGGFSEKSRAYVLESMKKAGARVILLEKPTHWACHREDLVDVFVGCDMTRDDGLSTRVLEALQALQLEPFTQKLQAVISFDDAYLHAASLAAERMGLPSNGRPPHAFATVADKFLFRNKVPLQGAKHMRIQCAEDVQDACQDFQSFPAILKPAINSGASVGAVRVSCREELRSAYESVSHVDTHFVLEGLVGADGSRQFSVDLVLDPTTGDCQFAETVFFPGSPEGAGCWFPSKGMVLPSPAFRSEADQRLIDASKQALHTVGFSGGVFHVEAIQHADNSVDIVEVNARKGGINYQFMYDLVWGIDLVAAQVETSLGRRCSQLWHPHPSTQYAMRLVLAPRSGFLEHTGFIADLRDHASPTMLPNMELMQTDLMVDASTRLTGPEDGCPWWVAKVGVVGAAGPFEALHALDSLLEKCALSGSRVPIVSFQPTERNVLALLRGGWDRAWKEYVFTAARERNIALLVIDDPGHWAGDLVQEGLIHDFVPCDMTLDDGLPARILSALSDTKVHGLCSFDDAYLTTVGSVAAALGLSHIPPAGVFHRCVRKDAMRKAFTSSGIAAETTRKFTSVQDLTAAAKDGSLDACPGFPLIVKPVEGGGGRGVYKTSSAQDVVKMASSTVSGKKSQVAQLWSTGELIVEPYVAGQEVDVDIIVNPGGGLVFGHTADNLPGHGDEGASGFFQEVGDVTPSRLPVEQQSELIRFAHDAVLSLGFKPFGGVFHVEARWSEGQPVIMEVNARVAGLRIPETVRRVYGVDLAGCAMQLALGRSLPPVADRDTVFSPPAPRCYHAVALLDSGRGGYLQDEGFLDALHQRPEVVEARRMVSLGVQMPRVNAGTVFWTGHVTVESASSSEDSVSRLNSLLAEHCAQGVPVGPLPVSTGPSVKTFRDLNTKHTFVRDLCGLTGECRIMAWVGRPRKVGSKVFFDLFDSTGSIQCCMDAGDAHPAPTESFVDVRGEARRSLRDDSTEIQVSRLAVLHVPDKQFHPSPRDPKFDPLAEENTKLCLDRRHIYIRHPKLQGIGRFRDEVSAAARDFFKKHSFLDFPAPILTRAILYEPSSAVPVQLGLKGIRSGPVYMTQCVGHYLEAAAMSHERVYSMCPSFRNESRSDRHLLEYWHIKAELAVGDLDTIICLVELFIKDVTAAVSVSGVDTCKALGTKWNPQEFSTPFPRLTYADAVAYLQGNGHDVTFEGGIKPKHEALLTRAVGERPLWIVGNSCKKEPFPYKIDKDDSRLTRTADLIAPNGFGEICGVAEKIVNSAHLAERMAASGHDTLPHMSFVRDVHDCGTVPHVAFGMGFERLVKWMLKLGHVRDCHPFPRVYGRDVFP